MLRKIIEYIRSSFCNHDYELIGENDVFKEPMGIVRIELEDDGTLGYDLTNPDKELILVGHKWVYKCQKCNHVKIIDSRKED